jgi:Asp-tRNA(Asn)/Glu-tRNA(Gln) amidotransferase A subunit family amidase
VDATVVERVLDAGGEIAGKAVCEYYCVSGGSHTSSTGPVHNPRKPGYCRRVIVRKRCARCRRRGGDGDRR